MELDRSILLSESGSNFLALDSFDLLTTPEYLRLSGQNIKEILKGKKML